MEIPLINRLVGLLLVSVTACASLGCEQNPDRWMRGYALEGEEVHARIDDWSFADEYEEIYIEKPWFRLRHSVSIWCVALDRQLYIEYYAEKKIWVENAEARGGVRLGIADKIYEATIQPVTDASLHERVDRAYNRKYTMEDTFGTEIPQWHYYAVSQLGS